MKLKLDKKKVSIIMAKKQLSIKEIADKMGVTLQCVVRLTQNENGLLPVTVGRLAEALGVEVEDIIED